MNHECCANCKWCDHSCGSTCSRGCLVIDEPYSDKCDAYERREDNADE